MNRLILLKSLVFAALIAGNVFSVQTSYPRTWENDGWIASNEHIMDFGYFEIWHTYAPANEIDWAAARLFVLPFHESLEEAELEALNDGCHGVCNSTRRLGTALRYKKYADDLLFLMGSAEAKLVQPAYQFPYAWNLANYVGNWKAAMDYSLASVEMEAMEVQAAQIKVSRLKGEVAASGICDVDYAGPGNWICSASVDDVACDSRGLWDSVPDMGWYPGCIQGHWSANLALREKYADMSASWEGAKTDLAGLRHYVRGLGEESGAIMHEVEFNELGRICLGVETRDIGGVAGIRDDYGELRLQKVVADKSMGNADVLAGSRGSGWYKNQYSALRGAQSAYERINWLGPQTLSKAGWIVEETMDGALASLAEARGSSRLTETGRSHLETAEMLCGLAGAETRMGAKFEKYSECRMHARLALEGVGIEDAAEYGAEIAETEAIVRKAERDGIDVYMEKSLVAEIREKKPTDSIHLLRGIRESVLGRAGLAYAGLPGERMRTASLIEMGGQDVSFLRTWLPREDCYAGAELDYLCAIGDLKDMREAYVEIMDEITLNAPAIIGNALIIDYSEGTTMASLDEDSEYFLVARARNILDMGAENVVFEVPAGASIGKVDLVDGGERVRLVSHDGGNAAIQLTHIAPGESIVLEFRKNHRPCIATGFGESAVGDALGRAEVTRTMRLDCSMQVDAIDVGSGAARAVLDGSPHSVANGVLAQRITRGTHALGTSYRVEDAYSIEKKTELVATAGSITTVSYMIDIMPGIDLERIPMWVDESAKAPSKIDVFGYTGERLSNVKKDGSGIVYFEINGLRSGELAKVRVKYEFTNITGYIEKRINGLAGADLGPEARDGLANASNMYSSGNYAGALAALEVAEAQLEKDSKAYAKLLERHRKLEMEVGEKAGLLREAVGVAEALGVDAVYVSEMRSRLRALEAVLGKNISSLSEKSPLEDIDLGWEGKEAVKIQKYVKDSETKIKKEWMAIGLDDAEMDGAISGLEEAGAVFSGTVGLVDGVAAMAAVMDAQAALDALKAKQNLIAVEKQGELSQALDSAGRVFARYESEYKELPSGHRLAQIFEKKPAEIRSRMETLGRSQNPQAAVLEAAKLEVGMESVLGFLEGESGRVVSDVNSIYRSSKDDMGDAERREVENSIELAKNYIGSKKYAKAILVGENALNTISGAGAENNDLLVLAATALLVIGAVAYLLFGRGGGIGGGAPGKRPKMRKLNKVVDDFE